MADITTVNKIFNEYEELRQKASEDRRYRMDEVYAAVPRIKEIENEIYSVGSLNMQNILKNPENADKLNAEMKAKFKLLNEEKEKLIRENNIDPDYDKYRYECSECGDTGYTEDGKKCRCFLQKLINEEYSRSNLGDVLKKQNFDTFSFDYYSRENSSSEMSPYDNMVKIYSRCKNYCENFDNEIKSLLFSGSTGLGKTFLSSCIAKELIDRGKIVVYVRATKLFNMYEDYKFGRNDDKSAIDSLYNADLLIIDDLGTEPQNKNNVSFLFDIICERLSSEKKLIINTNLSVNEMAKIYSSRFASRIYEGFEVYKFYGDDIRIEKLKNL